jgi:hypothetical protein
LEATAGLLDVYSSTCASSGLRDPVHFGACDSRWASRSDPDGIMAQEHALDPQLGEKSVYG